MNPEVSLSIAQLVTLIGAFQAVLLSLATFFWRKDSQAAGGTFAGIMLLLAVLMVSTVRRLSGGPPDAVPYAVMHLWGALVLVLGPLIYFHVRTSVDASYLFKWTRLLHFVPVLIHLSVLVPLLFVGPEQRATLERIFVEREIYRSLIPRIRAGLLVTSIYVLISFFWIRRYKRHLSDVASFGDEQHVRWLKWFAGLLVLLVFLLGLATLPGTYQLLAAGALAAFTSTVTFIAIAKPRAFHGIPTELKLSSDVKEDEKYGASQLGEAQKAAYLKTLRRHFQEEKPHLQHELTLREVAERVNIPYRHVSQVINEKLDLHFMDFVNGYRIETAKVLLLDPGSMHISIDGIAAEAGFKSRSAFYTAFKKATGETPGAFRKANPSQ